MTPFLYKFMVVEDALVGGEGKGGAWCVVVRSIPPLATAAPLCAPLGELLLCP